MPYRTRPHHWMPNCQGPGGFNLPFSFNASVVVATARQLPGSHRLNRSLPVETALHSKCCPVFLSTMPDYCAESAWQQKRHIATSSHVQSLESRVAPWIGYGIWLPLWKVSM